jgi:drug/metabolite transporter (DMT)-like permease
MRKENKASLLLIILVSTALGAVGQLLFKASLTDGISLALLGAGVIAYALSTLVYFYVLGRAHLSWAYGLNGLAYIFAVILAAVVLHEVVTPLRWVGVVAIAIGAALVGWS